MSSTGWRQAAAQIPRDQSRPGKASKLTDKPSRQDLRRWGNSLGVRLPAAIAREAHLHDNQTVELKVIPEGVLIRPVQPRLSLAERLAAYGPMPGEPTEAY